MGLEIGGGPVALARAFRVAVQIGVDSRFPVGALESQNKLRETEQKSPGGVLTGPGSFTCSYSL